MGTDDGSGGSPQLKVAGQVVALLIGIAGLLYILGGFVLALRLWFAGLPVEAIVAQLPEQFLVTVGLTEIVGPAVIGGALVIGFLIAWPRRIPHNLLSTHSDEGGSGRRRAIGCVTGLAVILVLLPGTLEARHSYSFSSRWFTYVFAIFAALASVVAARLGINHELCQTDAETKQQAADRRKPDLGEDYLRFSRLVTIGAWTALMVATAALIFVGGRQLAPVLVCPEDSTVKPIPGRLIGESGSKVYVAVGVRYRQAPNTRSRQQATVTTTTTSTTTSTTSTTTTDTVTTTRTVPAALGHHGRGKHYGGSRHGGSMSPAGEDPPASVQPAVVSISDDRISKVIYGGTAGRSCTS